jgi:hypothetical protein
MRRRPSRRLAALALGGALLVSWSPGARAQSDVGTEGALFLLLPVGARAVGMGHAVAAERSGSESVWWNPSGLARLEAYEVAIHHSQNLIATGDAVSVVLPFPVLGVFAISANILNYGEQEINDGTGTTGSLLPRSFVYAATYATPLGTRLGAGITYKVVQLRFDCTGACPPNARAVATTSALDLGVQYDVRSAAGSPVTVGLAVRNLGLRVQVNDSEQSDPLPTRVQIGVSYRLPPFDQLKETELRISGDLIDRLQVENPAGRVGLELAYQRRYFFRTGYVLEAGGGPAIGAGFGAGGLFVDIARVMGGLYAEAGEPPVHVSLRYLF